MGESPNAAHFAPVALGEGVLYVRVVQPACATNSNKSPRSKFCEN